MSAPTFGRNERSPRTVGEAAKELGCSRAQVFRLVATGPLTGLLFGRQAPLFVCGDSLRDVRSMLAREPLS